MSDVYLITIKQVVSNEVVARITSVQHPVFDFHKNIPFQILLESYFYLSYGGNSFNPKPFATQDAYDDLINQHPFRAVYEKLEPLYSEEVEDVNGLLYSLSEEWINAVDYDYEKVEAGTDPNYCDLTFKVSDQKMLFHLKEGLHWGSPMYDIS